jgi:hypothetical protein
MTTDAGMSTRTILGLVEYDIPMTCSKEVLGCCAPITVGGRRGVLELPSLPPWGVEENDPLHMPLVPPRLATTWKRGDEPIFWGSPIQYPKGISEVHLALMTFEVPIEEARPAANEIYRGFSPWLVLFETYVEIIAKQNITIDTAITRKVDRLELLRWNENGKSVRPYDDSVIEPITIFLSEHDDSLKPNQFSLVCKLCSELRTPAIEYRIMLEAYRALRVDDHRKAIIESATVAELVLTKIIQAELAKSGVAFADGLLKKFRMLQGRFDLARLIGIQLPATDYKSILIEPRNNVVHRANFSDKAEALKVVAAVEELLTLFSPDIAENEI